LRQHHSWMTHGTKIVNALVIRLVVSPILPDGWCDPTTCGCAGRTRETPPAVPPGVLRPTPPSAANGFVIGQSPSIADVAVAFPLIGDLWWRRCPHGHVNNAFAGWWWPSAVADWTQWVESLAMGRIWIQMCLVGS
jgi:hypothetical protein